MQQVSAAGALLAILQRDNVLSMSAPLASDSGDMEVDERQGTALHVESLEEVLKLQAKSLAVLCQVLLSLTGFSRQVSLRGFLNVDAVSQNALSIFQVHCPATC